MQNLILDIGGTNTRLCLARDGVVDTSTIHAYKNADYGHVEGIVQVYLAKQNNPTIHTVCADVAGPLEGQSVHMTNQDWLITTDGLTKAAGARTAYLINDMQAMGYAVTVLPGASFQPIVSPQSATNEGTKLVVNIGTGFNAVPIYQTPAGPFVPPSECGHIDLPLSTPTLLGDIQSPQTTVEGILSGRGLGALYPGPASTSHDILANMHTNPLAHKTLGAFARVFGKVCRDLALVHLPQGGIYLTGGLGKALAPHLSNHGFEGAFQSDGPFHDFIRSIAIHAITEDYAALYGAAKFADVQKLGSL
ncbi:MAG: glucokinase [Planktomarina sp.]